LAPALLHRDSLGEEANLRDQDPVVPILASNGFERSELEVPRDRLKEHGAIVRGQIGPDPLRITT